MNRRKTEAINGSEFPDLEKALSNYLKRRVLIHVSHRKTITNLYFLTGVKNICPSKRRRKIDNRRFDSNLVLVRCMYVHLYDGFYVLRIPKQRFLNI